MRFALYATAAAACVILACSNNPGFGGGPGPNYPNGTYGATVASASPVPSGSILPKAQGGASEAPLAPGISIAGASGRLAFDGSAADPRQAQRILILSFSVKNGNAKAISAKRIVVAGSGDFRPTQPKTFDTKFLPAGNQLNGKTPAASPTPVAMSIALDVPANKQSDVRTLALPVGDDVSLRKQIDLSLFPAKGAALATTTIEVAPADVSLTQLDVKTPKGRATIDGAAVDSVTMSAAGLHYKVTFALTNAGTAPLTAAGFSVTPPKGTPVKINLAVDLAARTTTSFITIVLPYSGKSLPSGAYAITAFGTNGATLASGTGDKL